MTTASAFGARARSSHGAIIGIALLVSLALPCALLAQSGHGTLVVLNKAAATASLIDLRKRTVYATLPTGVGPHEIAISPDGRWGVVANYGTDLAPGSSLTILDLGGRKVARTIKLGSYRRPHGVAWTPDGLRVVATVEADSAIVVVNARSGKVESAIRTNQGVSHMIVISRDGRRAYVANILSGSVTFVDMIARKTIRSVETGAGAEGIDLTPNGRELWVTNRSSNTVSVLDATTLAQIATIESSAFPIRVKITPDGKQALVSNAQSGELRFIDVASKSVIATLNIGDGRKVSAMAAAGRSAESRPIPVGIVIAPDGKTAYIANTNVDLIAIVDLQKRDVTGYLVAGREPDGMGWTKQGVGGRQ